MEVVLIRHTSVKVPKGVCYGWSDVPLSDTFEEEAAEVRKNLAPHEPFDAVFSSPLSRATALAAYCGHPDAITDDRLKELYMGDWEMRAFDDITDPELQEWYDDFMHARTKNGESFPMLYARIASFLDDLRGKPYDKVAIFAHGGVLMCAGIYAGLFTEEDAIKNHLPYGGIQVMNI